MFEKYEKFTCSNYHNFSNTAPDLTGLEMVDEDEWLFNVASLVNGQWEGIQVDAGGPTVLYSGIDNGAQAWF